jgi:hypothetical protein
VTYNIYAMLVRKNDPIIILDKFKDPLSSVPMIAL